MEFEPKKTEEEPTLKASAPSGSTREELLADLLEAANEQRANLGLDPIPQGTDLIFGESQLLDETFAAITESEQWGSLQSGLKLHSLLEAFVKACRLVRDLGDHQ